MEFDVKYGQNTTYIADGERTSGHVLDRQLVVTGLE